MSLSLDAAHIERIDTLDAARGIRSHGARLRTMLEAARSLRSELASGPAVTAVHTLPLVSLVYPARFAFQGAALSPAPLLSLTHRCALVQFEQRGARKTLLFNPTDIHGARRAPFFAQLIEKIGFAESVFSKKHPTLEAQLERLGLAPGDVDYVAFDHFHTQDLRALLGTLDGRVAPRFPNAVLLAPEPEWNDWHDLHPLQRPWFVAEGRDNVMTERVALTDCDARLGDGVVLLRTPGHTSGNQTLFFKTERGVWGISENGVCADNWSPRASRIAGLPLAARTYDVDVLLNANTPEGGAEQLTSMLLERAMVDPVPDAPDFVQMYASSEATPAAFAPGLSPTHLHGELAFGAVVGSRPPASKPAPTTGFGSNSGFYR